MAFVIYGILSISFFKTMKTLQYGFSVYTEPAD